MDWNRQKHRENTKESWTKMRERFRQEWNVAHEVTMAHAPHWQSWNTVTNTYAALGELQIRERWPDVE